MGFRHIQNKRRPTPNRNPLRKVVGTVWVEATPGGTEVRKEKLECGHLQFPVSDFAGETNAVRRRCWQCGKAATEGEK